MRFRAGVMQLEYEQQTFSWSDSNCIYKQKKYENIAQAITKIKTPGQPKKTQMGKTKGKKTNKSMHNEAHKKIDEKACCCKEQSVFYAEDI